MKATKQTNTLLNNLKKHLGQYDVPVLLGERKHDGMINIAIMDDYSVDFILKIWRNDDKSLELHNLIAIDGYTNQRILFKIMKAIEETNEGKEGE